MRIAGDCLRRVLRPRMVSPAFEHYGMLSDAVRMAAYERAIALAVKPGDVVVDLGAGLGILSLLAIRAGAKRVFAIEKASSIEMAEAVARENGMADRIVYLRGDSKSLELPERADVLISETLGSFGLDENTLDSVIDARQRFLKPDAKLLPERIRPWLVPVEVPGVHDSFDFWSDISGFDFSLVSQATIEGQAKGPLGLISIGQEPMLCTPQCLGEFNLYDVASPQVRKTLHFNVTRSGFVDGLVGWFEADLFGDVSLSTAPDAPATHWQQAFFPLYKTTKVVAGDVLRIDFKLQPSEVRSNDTRVEYRCVRQRRSHADSALIST